MEKSHVAGWEDDEFFPIMTTGLSLRELRDRDQRVFIASYLEGDPVVDKKGKEGRLFSVRMSPLPGSINKTREQQLAMVKGDNFVPEAWDLVTAILDYVDTTGVWSFANCWVRTATVTGGDGRLYVFCSFGRVNVYSEWDDVKADELGLAVARNY